MKSLFLVSMLCVSLLASELFVASAGGYKRPVTELIHQFESDTKIKVLPIFGNMQQIGEQIKHTDKISIFIGDEEFINRLGIQYTQSEILGKGKLVLVFAKEKNATLEMLYDEKISKIAMPDPKRAIYGNAANIFLSPYMDKLKEKLMIVQTVPQVSAYLLSGDIDAGFINETDYIGIAQKVGNRILIDENLYPAIKIVAVVVKGKNSQMTDEFLSFLQSAKAKSIIEKHGL